MGRDKEIKNTVEEGTNKSVNITVLQICNIVYVPKISSHFFFFKILSCDFEGKSNFF